MPLLLRGSHCTISPDLPVPLINNSRHSGLLRGIHDDLEMNAVLLEQAGERLVIISLDLLYAGPVLDKAIRKRLRDRYQIPGSNVVIAATHTHFAPSTDPAKPALGTVDECYLQEVVRKAELLVDTTCGSSPLLTELAWGRGRVKASVHRRLRWPWTSLRERKLGWTVLKAPNPFGPVDPLVSTLVFRDGNGKTQAILWNYACHPVGFPDHDSASAEYPGVVRKHLRERFGPSVPILFLQGFCGDLRPRLFQNVTVRSLLSLINRGPQWGAFENAGRWRSWAGEIAGAVDWAIRQSKPISLERGIACAMTEMAPERYLVREDGAPPLTMQAARLGDRCILLTVSAEPGVSFALALRKQLAGFHVMPVGYCGDVFGYLPTEKQRRYGGYEGDGYLSRICSYGPLRSGLDRIWNGELRSILENVGIS